MGQRRLVNEAQSLAIGLSAAIVVCMELFQVVVSSGAMRRELVLSAERSADEIAHILDFPLYTLDDDQAERIGEVMLTSRRVSGIVIRDSNGNTIIDRRIAEPSRRIPPIRRAVRRDGLHLGEVLLEYSDAELDSSIRRSLWTTLSVVIGIVLANIIAVRFVFTARVAKPFKSIVEGIGRIGKGEYEGAVARTGYGDVDILIDRFNEMAAAVREKNSQLKEANDLLELHVEERTRELESSVEELRKIHERLVAAEKLSALGHLAAGVTHELNTPLGAISSASATLSDFFAGLPDSAETFRSVLAGDQGNLFDRLLRLGMRKPLELEKGKNNRKRRKAARDILVQSGVGEAEAIAGLLADLDMDDQAQELAPALRGKDSLVMLRLVGEQVQAKHMAAIIAAASQKAATVVAALKSHLGNEAEAGPVPLLLRANIETAIALLSGELRGDADLNIAVGNERVLGYPERLAQVWINLVRNALQALGGKGTVAVYSEARDSTVMVSIRDDGPGIDAETQRKILNPYFSTKAESGGGIGLGLETCKQILQMHGGSIVFTSKPGETIFTASLPLYAAWE